MEFWTKLGEAMGIIKPLPFPGAFRLPKDRAGVYRVFGDPGAGSVDARWERSNMVLARDLPGRWNKGLGHLYCHRLAERYLRTALTRAQAAGVIGDIRTLGCFSFRHQRHDPKRPLSYHSWGIAVDINSADNGGWTIAKPPEPWSAAWLRRYPRGLSPELVEAFESSGWRWGGRWRGYVDPMHFELTR